MLPVMREWRSWLSFQCWIRIHSPNSRAKHREEAVLSFILIFVNLIAPLTRVFLSLSLHGEKRMLPVMREWRSRLSFHCWVGVQPSHLQTMLANEEGLILGCMLSMEIVNRFTGLCSFRRNDNCEPVLYFVGTMFQVCVKCGNSLFICFDLDVQ